MRVSFCLPLGLAVALLVFLLGGCGKATLHSPIDSTAHASGDFSSYAVSFRSPAEQTDFEKHLRQWCSEKGYAAATPAEIQALQYNTQTGAYQIAGVKYLDPANPTCSLLITYRAAQENEGIVGLMLTRDGSTEALERQSALVEAQRDAFLKEFPILSRFN